MKRKLPKPVVVWAELDPGDGRPYICFGHPMYLRRCDAREAGVDGSIIRVLVTPIAPKKRKRRNAK